MDREDIARRLFEKGLETLTPREQNVVRRFVHRLRVSRNVHREYQDSLTLGQRLADRVASFGGSWTFIGIFAVILVTWVALNAYILLRWHHTFDPYPYILLNLFLSMLAAIQAPIIMMSQNRQATKDRVRSEHDYEVNLKAELEIMALHDKLDALREKQWNELLALQQEQIQMLGRLVDAMGRPEQRGTDPGPHGKA